MNVLQIGICVLDYNAVFGDITDHMKFFLSVVKLVSRDAFVEMAKLDKFDAALEAIKARRWANMLVPFLSAALALCCQIWRRNKLTFCRIQLRCITQC
jgi:hypothetical protein